MNASDAAQAATLSPTFWLWGVGIVFQTVVFSVVGTWAVSRFIDKMIEKIRNEIDEVVEKLAAADSKVSKETGDSIYAMRQHVSNIERDFDKRCHAMELKAADARAHDLEFFARRESVREIAEEMRDGFDKVSRKIDEIRDRHA